MKNKDLIDFNQIDETGSPEKYVNFLDTASGVGAVKAIKQRSFKLLDTKPKHHILEVGCGTGDDARMIAEKIGPEGKVVAVDNSKEMINEAQKRHKEKGLPLEFVVGDTTALDFDSEIFDGCHFDRLLIHVPDPDKAVQEMVRVLKSGGRLVAFEPDLETFVVNSSDHKLTRKILNFWCDNFQNAFIARHLTSVFLDSGLMDIYAEPRAAIFDYNMSKELFIHGTLERAQEANVITEEEARRWVSNLEKAHEDGKYFCANMGFIVSGRKP
jgi:ubiquinone/menaquinone biosynthesis C-methylase UbiE